LVPSQACIPLHERSILQCLDPFLGSEYEFEAI
jgi:hypothetical protein